MDARVSTLTKGQLQDISSHAKDRLYCYGVLFGERDNGKASHAPVTLFPSPLSRRAYEQVCRVQTDFNLLVHRVANDYNFLKDVLENTIKVDDFTRRLWHIYETVRQEGVVQPLMLAMTRSDYFMDQPLADEYTSANEVDIIARCKPKQVELNTIAAGLGGLTTQLGHCHRYTMRLAGMVEKVPQIPENRSMQGLGKAVSLAWKQYGNPQAVVLFLVSSPENNIYDQRFLEYAILDTDVNIKVIRRTIPEMRLAALTEDKRLILDDIEIAVIYQRIGYAPDQFLNEEDWNVRLTIERSRTICCPSISYHLAGTKKVQQVLAQPGVLERFLPDDPGAVARIRETFTGLYSLEMGEDGDKTVAMAMTDPEKFVLKPQREGGGNNFFGEDIRQRLAKIGDSPERTEYILMDKIRPYPVENYILRCDAAPQACKIVSELGIFGALVGTENNILLNEDCGFIYKCKPATTNEGGVAAGFGAVDGPILV